MRLQPGQNSSQPNPASPPPAADAPAAIAQTAAAGTVLQPDAFTRRPTIKTAGVGFHPLGHLHWALRALVAEGSVLNSWLVKKIAGVVRPPARPADAVDGTGRARSTMAAIDQQMGVVGSPGLFAQHASGLYPTTVWDLGQQIAGALDVAKLTGDYRPVDKSMRALALYGSKRGAYNPGIAQFGESKNRLYDDNAWLGLNFMQAYQQTNNPDYLKKAQALFPFLEQGVSPQGGLYWEENAATMTRNTCSNGPAIQLALRLYMNTHDKKYLDFAQNLDQFMNTKLRTPEGLYMDNLSDSGNVGPEIYSYNQGTPIGADVLFYRVTGDKKYLDRATQTANAALDYYAKNDGLWTGAPSFNAIFFRNLLALDQVAPNPRYRDTFNRYLDRAWKDGRDPKTGLFDRGGMGAYETGKVTLIDNSGMAQLYALKDWPKDKLLDVS